HRVHTGRLAADRVHSSRRDLDILSIAEEAAEKALCHRAPANISCANEEDAFHESKPARCRFRNVKSNRLKSTRGSQSRAGLRIAFLLPARRQHAKIQCAKKARLADP